MMSTADPQTSALQRAKDIIQGHQGQGKGQGRHPKTSSRDFMLPSI